MLGTEESVSSLDRRTQEAELSFINASEVVLANHGIRFACFYCTVPGLVF